MAFKVQFADGSSPLPYADEVDYEFLPSGVLVLTIRERNVASYYAPGYWQQVETENGHKPKRTGYPL
jgi:hypothetical protein